MIDKHLLPKPIPEKHYEVYMIAGIHPFLNHAVTHCEIQHDSLIYAYVTQYQFK
jgi:hypothetical protein